MRGGRRRRRERGGGVAAGVWEDGGAALGEDRGVIVGHAEAGDFAGDEALQIAEGERTAVVNEVLAVDRRGAQHFAHLIDDLLRPFTDRADGGDLPRLFAFARELDEIVAAAPDAPTLHFQSFGDAEVERERQVAHAGDGRCGAELAQNDVEEVGRRGHPSRCRL